jgi:hypothetical protein
MLTATLGFVIATRVLTIDAFHSGIETSLHLTNAIGAHGAVYVHEDWKDLPQTPVVSTDS